MIHLPQWVEAAHQAVSGIEAHTNIVPPKTVSQLHQRCWVGQVRDGLPAKVFQGNPDPLPCGQASDSPQGMLLAGNDFAPTLGRIQGTPHKNRMYDDDPHFQMLGGL